MLQRSAADKLSASLGWGKNNKEVTVQNLFADLLRLTKPDYVPKNPDSLSTYFSEYMLGKRAYSNTYFPFDKLDFQRGLQTRIKNDYHAVLTQMDEFCKKYLSMTDLSLRQLIGGIVETIQADDTFDGSFDVGGRWVRKEELGEINEFSLHPFLASVWSIILSDYPDASEGTETYLAWTKSVGEKSPKYITTRIGTDRAMKIKVNVELPEASIEEKTPDLGEKKGPTEKTAEPEEVEAEIVEDVPYPETKTVNKEGRTYNQYANTIYTIEKIENFYG